ncbi:TIGR03067 domain-containing protein [bacterium]|nr:TIGR03067 domain-containing protein [bacterium]
MKHTGELLEIPRLIDQGNLLDVWQVVTFEEGGKARDTKNVEFAATPSTVALRVGDAVERRADYVIRPGQRAKEIDLVIGSGTRDQKTDRGIYAIEGDVLEICLDESGTRRPTGFTAGNAGEVLLVLKRKSGHGFECSFWSKAPFGSPTRRRNPNRNQQLQPGRKKPGRVPGSPDTMVMSAKPRPARYLVANHCDNVSAQFALSWPSPPSVRPWLTRTTTCWPDSSGAAIRLRSQNCSAVTARWPWACASGCSGTDQTPKTPSRPRSSSSP